MIELSVNLAVIGAHLREAQPARDGHDLPTHAVLGEREGDGYLVLAHHIRTTISGIVAAFRVAGALRVFIA
jgi:hypothetical protein